MSVENTQLGGARLSDVATRPLSSHRVGSRRRTLAKTFSWRLTATTTTFLIAWAITGNIGAGAAIGGVEAVAKLMLYYGHERAWERVPIT